ADLALSKTVVPEIACLNIHEWLNNFGRMWSLEGEKRDVATNVFHRCVNAVVGVDPLQVLRDVRCIDDEHEMLRGVTVHEKVINDCSVRVSHRRILGLSIN